MSRSRSEAIRAAAEVVTEAASWCRRNDLARVHLGSGWLPVFEALREVLALRLAGLLQGTPPRKTPVRALLQPAKRHLVRWARYSRNRRLAEAFLEGAAGSHVLLVPRLHPHVRDLLPVAAVLKSRGISCRWIIMRADLRPRLAGFEVAEAAVIATAGPREVARLAAELWVAKRALLAQPPGWGLSTDEWRTSIDLIVGHAAEQLDELVQAASSAKVALLGPAPLAVVVGNPSAFDGRIFAEGASCQGVPTACLQHGDLFADDPLWRDLPLDRICVWGPRSAEAMRDTGYGPEVPVVTGAPWTDRFLKRAVEPGTRRAILVTLSGAGHQVGATEHLATVQRLMTCAAKLRDIPWVFRIHPKDDASLYRQLIAEGQHHHVSVEEPAKTGSDVHDQLPGAAVLLTLTSTSAMDAMLQRVPVVTLARAYGEWVPDYVRAGATLHLEQDDGLAERLAQVVRHGAPAEVTRAAESYVEQFYGAVDGRAAQRVADAILALARPRPASRVRPCHETSPRLPFGKQCDKAVNEGI